VSGQFPTGYGDPRHPREAAAGHTQPRQAPDGGLAGACTLLQPQQKGGAGLVRTIWTVRVTDDACLPVRRCQWTTVKWRCECAAASTQQAGQQRRWHLCTLLAQPQPQQQHWQQRSFPSSHAPDSGSVPLITHSERVPGGVSLPPCCAAPPSCCHNTASWLTGCSTTTAEGPSRVDSSTTQRQHLMT
jgi:hypothetical protein